jgi:hypothetical protein
MDWPAACLNSADYAVRRRNEPSLAPGSRAASPRRSVHPDTLSSFPKMKSPLHVSFPLALIACASLGLGLGSLRAEDKKTPAAAPAKPAAAPAKPAAAPRVAAAPVRPAVVQRPAVTQLKTINSNTKSLGASTAGGIGFDGRRAPAGEVKANPTTNRKTAAQIAKEQNAIPAAQPRKLKPLSPPPAPPTH